ncbi:MAG: hypothetical protein K0A89_09855 [ANME-2 cluster archaeon]|nr:hypothetical protein [ANME-2 cluster archaeon]
MAESITISAMTASTPYSGSPIVVVMDRALTAAEDDTAALVVELARVDETAALAVTAETVVADTVVAETVVDEITLVSIYLSLCEIEFQ